MLKNKQKSKLKYIANSEEINKYILGKNLIGDTFIDLIDKALLANELIKVSVLKTVSLTMDEIENELATTLNAEIISKVGRTLLIYRKSLKNNRISKIVENVK